MALRLLAPLGAVLVLMTIAPSASATHVQCGDVITQDTTLDSDLIDCAGDGIIVGAAGLRLNLARHTIDGTGGGNGVTNGEFQTLTFHPFDGLVIENGTIREFNSGIRPIARENPGDAAILQTLTLTANDHAMLCNFSECHVDRSLIRDNRSNAILFGTTSRGTVLRSWIQDNLGHGIAIFNSDVTIADSNITGNGHDERFEDELGSGVLVWQTPDAPIPGRAEVLRNVITGNARDGVEIADTASESVVSHNRADRNGDDGLDVDAPGSVISDNRAFFNGDFGIEAIAGTVDGGGNKAKHNGNPAQCSGVSCK